MKKNFGYDELMQCDGVIIYGAGKAGSDVLKTLKSRNFDMKKIVLWDKKYDEIAELHGIPVDPPQFERLNVKTSHIVVIALGMRYLFDYMDIREKFLDSGYSRIISYHEIIHSEKEVIYSNNGVCPICEDVTTFTTRDSWYRDYYFCEKCRSIPRHRAFMVVLDKFCPNWRELVMHDSSPGSTSISWKLKRQCKYYIGSQFFSGLAKGDIIDNFRNEDLTQMTFDDESIDLHVTQDVVEHVLEADKAFSEIARTLKPVGMHIFTVPIVRGVNPTVQRATIDMKGGIIHLEEPMYHGNPIGDGKSLVTWDWGYDIIQRIYDASKMHTICIQMDNLEHGIRAEYIDVFVSVKPRQEFI